jgi:hypothetical protein
VTTPTPSNPNLAAAFALPGAGSAAAQGDSPALQLAATQRILAMTRATQQKLEPQLALVVRALNGTGKQLSESPALLPTPLPLKSSLMVDTLQSSFMQDAALAEHTEQIVLRFREAAATVASVEAAVQGGQLEAAQVQSLKLAAFYFARFHEVVKDDPVLSRLFPAPQVLQADAI